MLFSPAQMREFSTLTENTITNWRKAGISLLESKKGRQPQYTISEILTLIILDKLKYTHGGRVEIIVPMAQELEQICSSKAVGLFKYENPIGFLCCADEELTYHIDELELTQVKSSCLIIIPLAPIIKDLRDRITLNPTTQLSFEL